MNECILNMPVATANVKEDITQLLASHDPLTHPGNRINPHILKSHFPFRMQIRKSVVQTESNEKHYTPLLKLKWFQIFETTSCRIGKITYYSFIST